jgi:beta-N-acetylhexosaminidase
MTKNEDWKNDIGELLLVGFDGTTLTDSLRTSLEEGRVGGVILFSRNIEGIEQVLELTSAIHAASRERVPFVAIDQEGGPVQRIKKPLPEWPAMRVLGDIGDPELCARVGEAMGDELAELGFNLNFAPCADVDSNPDNPIIGERAFSSDATAVSRFAGAYAAGMTISGMVSCAKHFPGHGDTMTDSHLELPRLTKTMEELNECELRPFRSLIDANVPMVMTAHILFEAIDAEHPATFSPAIISELLRMNMGFDRVVISDDLEMNAVSERYEIDEAVELGLRAGIDIFLICRSEAKWQQAYETLLKLGESDSLMRSRIREAAARVRNLREHWLLRWQKANDPIDAMDLPLHEKLIMEIEERHKRVAS